MFTDSMAACGLAVPKLGRTLQIRAMRIEDLPAVVALEKELFRSPWSAEMFREDLDQEYACSLVVLDGDLLAGYMVTYFIADEIHIANVAVVPEYQRRGIGVALLKRFLTLGKERGIFMAHLEVRASNAGAIALYQKIGFEKVGLRKNYYEVEQEDAVLMSSLLQINPHLMP